MFTTGGLIATVAQVQGQRYDLHGLYALMETSFEGTLVGDNGYWTDEDDRRMMFDGGLRVAAFPKSNQHAQYLPITGATLRGVRGRVERRIGLFDRQFHAGRTLNRSRRHYIARRLAKAAAHNSSRRISTAKDLPTDSVEHFRLCA